MTASTKDKVEEDNDSSLHLRNRAIFTRNSGQDDLKNLVRDDGIQDDHLRCFNLDKSYPAEDGPAIMPRISDWHGK
jgi:hypothetical protein